MVGRRLLGLALVLALASLPLPPAAAWGPGEDAGSASYVVMLAGGSSTLAAAGHEARFGLRVERTYSAALTGYSAVMTAATARRLERQPGVLSVERDAEVRIAAQQLDTGVDRVSLPATRGATALPGLADGADTTRVDADIAILDTGSGPHPDLNVVARTDCMVSRCRDGSGVDGNGHGTHVAGIAAAIDNGIGSVGVAPGARIWSVRVLGNDGTGSISTLIAGIDWVTRHADVIDVANMSIGCSCVSTALDAAFTRSVAAGVAYAVAAGNSAVDASPYSISNHPDVLTVSALADFDGVSGGAGAPTCRSDTDDTLAAFSNWGAVVDLTAPGVCIRSAWLGGSYAVVSGTSMASPHVAGAAALLASDPAYRGNPALIRNRLLADGNSDWTDDSGDGITEPLLDVSSLVPTTVSTQPRLTVAVSDSWVTESGPGAVAHFTVATNRPLVGGEVVDVTAATKAGTAKSPGDFTAAAARVLRLTPAQGSVTVDVPVASDSVPEGSEVFYLDLSSPLGATLADSRGSATIVDISGPLTVSVGDATVGEPATGGPTAAVEVSLSSPVPAGHQVSLVAATAAGTATASADYVATTQTLVFAPGQQTKTVDIGLLPDDLREIDETFSVKLSSVAGAVAADATGLVTVTDDEGPIQISVSNVWLPEGDAGTSSAGFAVRLSTAPAAGQSVTVYVATADGTAKAGLDYTKLAKTKLTFAAGTTEQVVTVPVTGDTLTEGNETFRLVASSPTGALLADADGWATIATDDGVTPAPAPITVSVSDARLTESAAGSQAGTVDLRLSSAPPAGQSVSVTVATADSTATAGADYVAVPSTVVVFGPGETVRSVDLAALDDTLAEPTESFAVKLSAASGAVLADAQAAVSVVSDEAPITVAASNAWVLEPDTGTVDAQVAVRLSQAPAAGQSVSVVVATADSTAKSVGDYTRLVATRVTFAAGEQSKTLTIPVAGDLLAEGNETFSVTLSSPIGLTVADSSGAVTIADDEGPVWVSAGDAWVLEGASASTTPLVFTARLSSPPGPGQLFKVTVTTVAGGTATAGLDYATLASTVLTFNPGETSKPVTVSVTGDNAAEIDETLLLSLASATGGVVISDATAVATLLNDD